MISLKIEPIADWTTEGWREPVYVRSAGIPREGDGIAIKVGSRKYDVRVRWVFWTMTKDDLLPTVRVR